MKRILVFAALAAIICLSLAVWGPAQAEMPGPDAAALWKYITDESPYTKWSFWPDHKDMQPGRSPHGQFHKVFVNKPALEATKPPLPDGSIVVKENFTADKKLAALTIMYKVKGYDPDNGDWYYVKYDPDGTIGPAGKVKGCIACHAGAANNDYIFVHPIK